MGGQRQVSVMREWKVMAQITRVLPLGGACVILSPHWKEGSHAFSALQTLYSREESLVCISSETSKDFT